MQNKIVKIYQNTIYMRDINEENKEPLSRILLSSFMGDAPEQKDIDNYYEQVSEIIITEQDEVLSLDDLEVCEYAFYVFNVDNRPDGQLFRSMSVGDIVKINDNVYLCCSIGFKKVNLVTSNITKHNNIQYYDYSSLKQSIAQ